MLEKVTLRENGQASPIVQRIDYDAKGQLKPEKILESLTDVRQIIKGIDKERRLEMLKN